MGALTGIKAIGAYTGSATAGAAIDKLLALIPDPDLNNATSSGAMANPNAGAGNLDEMSPIAAAHLRVELLAIKDEVGAFVDGS
jgi:hypothetical protein